ncbi:hypothetical protein [Sphingobacterium psychroaquaticum]|uniref:Uncharacterized protein n=1 Tax=Sphingobacterium psychroaquaticum TaxID=561061 RepID=A0A1X7IYM4_9SPHI|nr:hypothetical protein [Sphingobacterium psychroaquaticum]SMG20258.1 hypothetical protein SAMN05660862_1218 [Sphingobacterium psychroaquaticum]
MKENNTYHDDMEDLNLPDVMRVNPFAVPLEYFADLSQKINSQVQLEKLRDGAASSFTVPENYFQNLEQQILSTVKLDKQIGSHTSDGFSVPEDYFDTLSASIRVQVKFDNLLPAESFTVPTGYFDELENNIHGQVREAALRDRVQETGFSMPNGYLENLTKEIKAKTSAPQVTTPVRRLNFQKWVQYAAAACVATVLGVTSYQAIVTEDPQTVAAQAPLQQVSDAEILNYLAYSMDSNDLMYVMKSIYQPKDEEEIGKNVDKDDIEDYLKYML